MPYFRRVFILGAGFSSAAGMPLATRLLPLLVDKLKLGEMRRWLDELSQRLDWLSASGKQRDSLALNIEQIFHFAHFEIEAHRLRQHLSPVGRLDGETPWDQSESIAACLSYLEEALRDVISECDDKSDLTSLARWAQAVNEHDAVLSFNYDTLTERALKEAGKRWNHGMGCEGDNGNPVFKLHGSIDWIVAHRCETFSKLDLLFDKPNANRSAGETGHVEDDCRLWRCRTAEQRRNWIESREFQLIPRKATPRTVGIAGLGAYKELHQVPGLGRVWARGMNALYRADRAVVVGFAMSDFDAMAHIQFAEVVRARQRESRALTVTVIDPYADEATKERFRRVFRSVEFVPEKHEDFDWSNLE